MTFPNGQESQTTFNDDFAIAEMFGLNAVENTFKRAFKEWRGNTIYLTELVIITNLRCWFHHDNGNEEMSRKYADYYYIARDYALDHLSGEDYEYFFNMTD